MTFGIVIMSVLAFTVFLIVITGIKVVKQSECMIVERLGKYHSTLNSGLNIVLPIIDSPRYMFWVTDGMAMSTSKIDLRETVLDVPEQAVITRDNVSINIDAILYVQVIDPIKATYEISNLPTAVAQLAQTSLRNVIGEMDLDETLASRDTINAKLKAILDEATDKWGTKVNRVEIKNIKPPLDIQQAMEKQMQAERERRAQVLEAQGDRQARVERSEGERQEQINLADGDREAQIKKAEGEAEAIRKVAAAKRQAIEEIKSAIGDTNLATQYIVATNYLDVFGRFVQKPGDKVYVPYESSTALGAIGSIKELIKEKP